MQSCHVHSESSTFYLINHTCSKILQSFMTIIQILVILVCLMRTISMSYQHQVWMSRLFTDHIIRHLQKQNGDWDATQFRSRDTLVFGKSYTVYVVSCVVCYWKPLIYRNYCCFLPACKQMKKYNILFTKIQYTFYKCGFRSMYSYKFCSEDNLQHRRKNIRSH